MQKQKPINAHLYKNFIHYIALYIILVLNDRALFDIFVILF